MIVLERDRHMLCVCRCRDMQTLSRSHIVLASQQDTNDDHDESFLSGKMNLKVARDTSKKALEERRAFGSRIIARHQRQPLLGHEVVQDANLKTSKRARAIRTNPAIICTRKSEERDSRPENSCALLGPLQVPQSQWHLRP